MNNPLERDYNKLLNGNRVYVRIDDLSTGSFKLSNQSKLIACVGHRRNYKPYKYEFRANSKNIDKTWRFAYDNIETSSFVVVLFKKKTFGSNKEIGEIELRAAAFQPNTIVTEEFTLISPDSNAIPAKVTLSVHVSENGAKEFKAPKSGLLFSNAVIHRQKLLCD